MSDLIKKLVDGDLENFRQSIFNTLYTKAGDALGNRKIEISNNLYSEESPEEQPQEESEES